jgi:PAS domain S-box-containing protein
MKRSRSKPHRVDIDAFHKSQTFYKKLVESLEAYAIVTVSPDGTVKSWNAGAEKIMGYKASEVIGKNHKIFFTPEDRKNNIPAIQLTQALNKKDRRINEGWRQRKNGERFWSTGFVFPLYDEKKRLVGFSKIIRDRTKRQRAEEERRRLLDIEKAAHGETTRVLSKLAEGVIVFTMEGKVQSSNRSAEKILGLTKEQLLEKSPLDNRWHAIREDGTEFPPESHPARVTIETGKPLANVVMGIRRLKDRKRIWVLINSTPLFRKGKKEPYAVVASYVDITFRKNLEREKDSFIGTASHELKTPLTSLTLFSDILRKKAVVTENKSLIDLGELIHAQTERLIHLMNDLLDVSRIQSGKLELHYQKYDLDKAIVDLISFIQMTTQSHKIEYKSALTKKVYADKDRINQVITNLLTNAIKYSPKSDKIIVRAKVEDNKACISVQDFGYGIPKDEHKKIFERFFRTEYAQQQNIAGFGLGLNITNEIIKRHKGELTVKSAIGKGSTFSFWIPIK